MAGLFRKVGERGRQRCEQGIDIVVLGRYRAEATFPAKALGYYALSFGWAIWVDKPRDSDLSLEAF